MPQRYLLIQRSPTTPPGTKREPPSPAEMQAMFDAFNAWKEKFKNEIVDMGGRLKPDGRVVSSSGVTDGPFVEVKEVIGGYMLVEADSYEQAAEVALGICGRSPATTIEVREIATP